MTTQLKLYNTLTRKKEIFKPIKDNLVRMYVCGPTVNDVPHLGHARQQIVFDILRKHLKYIGYKVKFVSNITDIEDKIIKKSNELKIPINQIAQKYAKIHMQDYASIGIEKPDIQPKATQYVKQMIDLIKNLEKKNYVYIIPEDGVYFNISKFKSYGKLSHQNIKTLKSGVRIKIKNAKKDKNDFVLWKFSKPNEPSWNSSWGKGRPGWHIECSVMSKTLLELPFDIHGGGQDLIFPHHEDEIAQSEAGYGKKITNFWIHNGMVNVNKTKMSKSLGNFLTIRELLKSYPGNIIRYLFLMTHYKKPIDFSIEKLDSAKNSYEKLKRKIIETRTQKHKGKNLTKKYETEFINAMNNNLNTPKALQVFYRTLDDFSFDPAKKIKLLEKIDNVFGLGIKNMKKEKLTISKQIKELVKKRESLRKEKKWAESDIAREKIRSLGYIVEDTGKGPKLQKIS